MLLFLIQARGENNFPIWGYAWVTLDAEVISFMVLSISQLPRSYNEKCIHAAAIIIDLSPHRVYHDGSRLFKNEKGSN
jgi:hypothetical protein